MKRTEEQDTQQAPQEEALSGRRYWKSLDELVETPGFKNWMENEFPQGAAASEGLNRRNFVKIMGASFALAGFGMAGCRRPKQEIVPYQSTQPEYTIPGVPEYFATSLPSSRDSLPLLVETHSNRPTMIEGNARFKPYGGSISSYGTASILGLYDPDRAQYSFRPGKSGTSERLSPAQVEDYLAGLATELKDTQGEGFAMLLEGSTSPSRARLLSDFAKQYPKALLAEYDAIDGSATETAGEALFGKATRPLLKLEKAKRVLSLDADFLCREDGSKANARGFSKARRVMKSTEAKQMNRLYQVESDFSMTGGMADHRLRLNTSAIPAFAAAIGAEILRQKKADAALVSALEARAEGLAFKDKKKWISACVRDLLKHSKHSVIVAGDHLPEAVHALVYALNDWIGATGHTVDRLIVPSNKSASLGELNKALDSGSIKKLVIVDGNPVYNAPSDIPFAKSLKKAGEVIRFGTDVDETTEASSLHVAATHYLEQWGDGRTYDGTYLPVQPMILPIFEGLSTLTFLARLLGDSKSDDYGVVKQTFASRQIAIQPTSDERKTTLNDLSGATAKAFNRWLNQGFLPDSGHSVFNGSYSKSALKTAIGELPKAPKTSKDALELRILPSAQVLDGRYANNGWMQELPEPANKTCWDNTINISPKLAKELAIQTKNEKLLPFFVDVAAIPANKHESGHQVAPVAKLTIDGVTITGPVNIQPGLANDTITVAMGFGRTQAGRIGNGVGFSIFPLSQSGSTIRGGAKLELTNETVPLANVQQHWSMEGRAIIREASVDEYAKHPDFVDHMGAESHSPPIYGKKKNKPLEWLATNNPRGGSAYETPKFTAPQQWGMSIDLNTCTGCNECVIACQAENNIPIVGKEQVIRGREMHWIRIDRYYSGGDYHQNMTEIPEDPQVSMQPMNCQQCEMAPCEQVCPVNATVHDEQGLNTMAYNRCVGTRYCANNCPYKVRRFNFYDWNKRKVDEFALGPLGENKYETQEGQLMAMQANPDVSVRMRGVMEKCTYCQQRIEEAKINQKAKAKDSSDILVPDGVIKTACQQACPTEAILFGDIADNTTEVYKAKQSDRDYSVLGYLNTRPRTTYLARLRNPNEEMPDYQSVSSPKTTQEYHSAHGGHHEESGASHDSSHDTAGAAAHGAANDKAH